MITSGLYAGARIPHRVGDPYWQQVALLLHCEGADNSTLLVDSSRHAVNFTTDPVQANVSTAQAKFGAASLRVNRASGTSPPLWTGTRFTAAAGVAGALTFECWFKRVSNIDATESPPILRIHASDGAEIVRVSQYRNLGNDLQIRFGDADTASQIGYTPAADGWTHIAILLSAGTLRVCAEGVSLRTFSYGSFASGAPGWNAYVGAPPGGTGTGAIACYIDEVRYTTDVARYTSFPFTPPTAPFLNY